MSNISTLWWWVLFEIQADQLNILSNIPTTLTATQQREARTLCGSSPAPGKSPSSQPSLKSHPGTGLSTALVAWSCKRRIYLNVHQTSSPKGVDKTFVSSTESQKVKICVYIYIHICTSLQIHPFIYWFSGYLFQCICCLFVYSIAFRFCNCLVYFNFIYAFAT